MSDCIFCKIINKEKSADIVYENENFIAFLDIRPASVGHTLVIPKKHYRWVWDVPNIGEYFEVCRKVALAERKAFDVEAIWCGIKGDEVPHAHISIMTHSDTPGDKKDFVKNLESIKKNI